MAARAAACLCARAGEGCEGGLPLYGMLSKGRSTEQAARHCAPACLPACLPAYPTYTRVSDYPQFSLPACQPASQPSTCALPARLPSNLSCLQFGDDAKYISLFATPPILVSEIGVQHIVAYADGKCPPDLAWSLLLQLGSPKCPPAAALLRCCARAPLSQLPAVLGSLRASLQTCWLGRLLRCWLPGFDGP